MIVHTENAPSNLAVEKSAALSTGEGALGLAAAEDASRLDRLNAAQREAVTTTEGHVRVIAGAGTGKTRALTERFAYLVCDLGIMPGNILCVTFTNKAANEMRRRIRRITGDNDTGYISTFHGFCVSVLQEDSHALGYPKSFLVLDNADIDSMLKIIYEERGLTLRNMTFSKARDMIEVMKLQKHPLYYREVLAMPIENLRQRYLEARDADEIIFFGYLYQQKKCFGLDYNDLIVFTLHLFEQDPDIKLKWQKRLQYIMVDEFQDIDGLQYQLMEALAQHHGNLFVVGDPDQTIYTWRGANVRYLLDFDQRFQDTRTIMMLQNYRSVPRVIDAANSLIEKNRERMPKRLEAMRASYGPTVWHHAEGAAAEANWIAEGVLALYENGVDFGDIAVLYRAHYASRSIEEAFIRAEIPHVISSGTPFFNRREVKDALAYLRLVAYKDDLDFERVANAPKRNLGQRRMAYLREIAEQRSCSLFEALKIAAEDDLMKGTKARHLIDLVERHHATYEGRAVSDVLASLLAESGYERMLRTEGSQERLDNLAELKQSVRAFEESCGEELTLTHYLAHVALLTNADAETSSGKVRLMTIHAAKGLEFPHVFICSMSEGVIPSRKTDTMQAMEEERRLAFVAMTRARDGLYLSEAEGRDHDGIPRFPSRFLLDIDPAAIDFSNKPADERFAEARAAYGFADRRLTGIAHEARFAEGDRVRHPAFGTGVIVSVDGEARAYEIQFDQLETTRSVAFRAKMTKA